MVDVVPDRGALSCCPASCWNTRASSGRCWATLGKGFGCIQEDAILTAHSGFFRASEIGRMAHGDGGVRPAAVELDAAHFNEAYGHGDR